ncbi:MAG TPA: RnfABCDGE type electron transport complex subunit D [Fluviicoccus sp.]|nr:RnfABCDGE type electron transport complex subunit D [Fluviicoccus sp.]
MALMTVTSPHATGRRSTGQVMRHVVYAAVPGMLALAYAFGAGVILNVLWCVLSGVLLEAACLKARGRPVRFFLLDFSVVVTGLLLGLAIPPSSPWWIGLIGMLFAVPIAKHLYGGLGSNPFNPAMIAYALLLVSFPAEMTRWNPAGSAFDPVAALKAFAGQPVLPDALSGATPLDVFRQKARTGVAENALLNEWVQLQGWAAVNLAFLLGGAYLLWQRIISWHIPVSLLLMLGGLSTAFYLFDPAHYGSPLFHLLSGATMLGAFFIATDPVTAATSRPAQLVYGAGIGALIFIIRSWGGYPDAVAFSVLLMNLAAPTIDLLVKPRTFGHDVKPVKWKGGKS